LFPFGEKCFTRAADIFKAAVDILGIEYGYFYVRDSFCLPEGFSTGVSPAFIMLNDADEDLLRWAWFSESYWSHPSPPLRDVFQINLVSSRHHGPDNKACSLSEWIAAERGRGALTPMGNDRFLWTLTDAEMFNIRPILAASGRLFASPPRAYRDLDLSRSASFH
jgi:hypothetical protein